MNKRLQILSFLCFFMMIMTSAAGQVLNYSYDESGNRILREPGTDRSGTSLVTMAIPDSMGVENSVYEKGDDNEKVDEPFRAFISPNPVSSEFELELPDIGEGEKGSIQIYDSMRQPKLRWSTVQKRQQFNIGIFSPGIYILYVTIGDKTVVRKLIKTLP